MSAPEATVSQLAAALRYAQLGWQVFPLHTPVAGGCSCSSPEPCSVGKHPRTNDGFKSASTDEKRIRGWWRTWPDANVGIATGERSGFFVLDVDPEKGGDATLGLLISEHGALPETVEALTGSGGRHVLFKYPGHHIPNSTQRLGAGLDVRGDGGYIVAAPSLHRAGRTYEWQPDCAPGTRELAAAPAWFFELLRAPARSAPLASPSVALVGADVLKRAAAYLARIPQAISGSRGHDQTWKAALAIVRGFGLGEADAFALLAAEYNPRCQPPWSEKELRHKVQSAARDASVSWGYLRDASRPAPPASPQRTGEPLRLREEPGCDDGDEPPPGWGLTWLEDFLARDFPPTQWLYLDLVQAKTTCIVVAPPNAGKTLLAFDLGAQIVAAALGRGAQGVRAAIVEEEGTGAALQQRLSRAFAAAGGLPKRAVKVAWNSGRSLTNQAELDQLAGECAGADLIVLDSLADLSDVDENDVKEMKLLGKALRRLQTLTGATVIALHHMTKEVWSRGQVPSLRHLRGHGALAAKVDTVLGLVPGDEETGRVNFDLYCLKQRDGEKARPRRVAVCMTGPAATVEMEPLERKDAGERGGVSADALTAEILAEIPLDKHGGVISKAKLAKVLRRNEKAVSASVDALIEARLVRVVGQWGLVRLPPPAPPGGGSAEVADPA